MGRFGPALALSVFSGVLLALSFPHYGHFAFAWIALVPLLLALACTTSVKRAFALGFVTGTFHFTGTVYWIAQVMVEYGGLARPVAWVVHALLIAYLALFPALFATVTAFLCRRFGPGALFSAPAVWVTTELGRLYLFTGFPWELLGYSQTNFLPIAQTASLVGVLGVSALVILINGTIAYTVVGNRRQVWRPLGAVAVLVLASVVFGTWRLGDGVLVRAGTPLRGAALQGNVAQDDKWNPVLQDGILADYLDLTRQAASDGAELIIWPEAAAAFTFGDNPRSEAVRAVARTTGTHLLVGSTLVTSDVDIRYYNAAIMLDPAGMTAGVYQKQHLVPFGEYVPFRQALSFVSPLVETVAGFSAGPGPRTLPVAGLPVSTAICYEIIFPGLVREFVESGSQLLTTITNDAWYGRSSAPHQHFQQATMRAIEQGRFLVRAANTGITGVIDPYGHVLARTPLFEPAMVVEDVRLLDGLTVYARIGDALAYACAALTLLLLWVGRRESGQYTRLKWHDSV